MFPTGRIRKLAPADVTHLVVHCSATPASRDVGAKDIDRWHRDRGFFCIGYHFVIRRDGTVEAGRPTDRIGAHVEGWNSRSIGICMVGGVNDKGKAEDNFTPAQFDALATLLYRLQREFNGAEVIGHRDTGAKKDCPSFDVKAWFIGTGG